MYIREAITAGHAGIARRQWQGSSDLRRDWRTPQTHHHHVVGRRTLLDGITCCIAFAENGRRPWTACNTSDDVRFSTVTNCCRTWTFDSISPASCCSCKAADRALSLPTWWTQYSGLQIVELDTICRHKIWSTGLLIVRYHPKWTPWVSCSNRGEATECGWSWCISNGPSRDKSGTSEGPPIIFNFIVWLTTVMRRSCRTRGQGNSRKQTTRRVPRERRTSLTRHWQDTHRPRRWMRKPDHRVTTTDTPGHAMDRGTTPCSSAAGGLAGIDCSSSRSVPGSICGVTTPDKSNSASPPPPRMTAHVREVRL